MRGTTNGNARGNTKDRAARKRYLLANWAALGRYVINGRDVPCCRCYRCGCLLHFGDLTVDRIVPGCQGGKYVRTNIRPACADCNSETGGSLRG